MPRLAHLVANERDLKTLLDAGHFGCAIGMVKSFITLLLLAQLLAGGSATASTTYGEVDGDGDIDFKDIDESSDCGPQTLATTTSNTLLDVNTLLCRVARLIRSVLRQLNATKRPIVIMRGLEIVPSKDEPPPPGNSLLQATVTAAATTSPSDTSLLGRFSYYLRTHELNIKFSDLLAEESERHAARDADQNGANVEEGRNKKDKGHGHGTMLMISIMFSKLLAVMTMGGISAVAMKALGIAMAALMMSSMHGLKAMHGHSKDEGHHGRRRRRNVGATTWPSGGITALPLPPGSRASGEWKRKTSAMRW